MQIASVALLCLHLAAAQTGNQCPDGSTPASCFVDPCRSATCPNYPNATCRANYCRSCGADFFLSDRNVTANCTDPCTLSPAPGPCEAYGPSFFYNFTARVCQRFIYGGCQGNDNRFPTARRCLERCNPHSVCNQPIYPPGFNATCDVVTRQWTYNATAGRCEAFFYAACGEDREGYDVFSSQRQCNNTCVTPPPDRCATVRCAQIAMCPNGSTPTTPEGECCPRCPTDRCATVLCAQIAVCPDGSAPTTPEGECCPQCPPVSCSLRPQVGDCDGYFPRFFYNSTARVCQRFVYGGCGGNANRFMSARACLETCNPHSVCNQQIYPRDSQIICQVIVRQWTYNATAGQCMAFNYSPCGQDREGYNVFDSEIECNNICVAPPSDPCTLPPAPGPCEAYGPSFFYNFTARVCQRFIYGGCQGNDNRFPTARRCLERCNPHSVCNQPIYPPGFNATCEVVTRQWTYNATAGRCEAFPYALCGQDRKGYDVFSSQRECNNTCVTPPTCRGSDGREYQVGDTFPAGDGCNTCTCTTGGRSICTLRACPVCPDGLPLVRCFADPCSVNTCPNYPDARCVANYCGGCNAVFYDSAGNDVTTRCAVVLPIPIQAEVCPAVEPDTGGVCAELCSSDQDCNNTMKCCSNGCGRSCMVPDRIPYYSIPRQCPSSISDRVGVCTITPNNCQSDKNCSGDQLCCRSGCGRVCTNPVQSSQPCFAITDQFNRTRASDSGGLLGGASFVGAYIPQCAVDGSFQPIQCHGSTGYCWCVHTQTGRPLSPFTPRGSRTQCTVTCNYNGRTYYPGQGFPASDGCNMCSCSESGLVACTRRACVDTCVLPPDSGPCRGAFQAYYYDFERGSCRSFVYGGCGGNNNKFKTIRDCLRRCDANNTCLLPREPGNCRAAIPSFFFNTTSGVCERFTYGGCNGNGNRFSTGAECQRTCDPSSPIDRCLDIVCPVLDCPAAQQVRDPDECCATCVPQGCRDNQFLCSNGTCVSESYICDGLRDCPDGGDEADCPRGCDFMCGDGVCIPERYVCDGYLDCRDGSDARNCPTDFANTYYPDVIPRQCPNATGLVGICVEACSSNDDCGDDGKLCCSNGCGRTCLPGNPATPLCSAILRQVDTSLVGAFVPRCERDGSFSQIQCHPSTGFCWCVDTATGRPQSDGVRGRPNCGGCTDYNGIMYPYGERFLAEDGCNICYCTGRFGALCTRRNCIPGPCRLGSRSIAHNTTYRDDCSLCRCQFGELTCQRRPCAITALRRQPARITMPFRGNFSSVASSDDRREQLKREVIRTFLTTYGASFGLLQEQINSVEVKEGSVIVIVTLSDSQNSSSGANITILIGQLQQDFDAGSFVIRVNNEVLEPSGQLQVEDETTQGEAAFPWWGILLICVGGLIFIVIVLVLVLAGVVRIKRSSSRSDGYLSDSTKYPAASDYEIPVAYKKVLEDSDAKEAL